MQPHRVLLFGGTGQVGRELAPALATVGVVLTPTRADADLADPQSLRRIIRSTQPAVIVNAAALTNVDRAEREPELARALNEAAPGVIAEEAARAGALMVHYSTDYVFDGRSTTPYVETDSPNPINVYGASKLAGERRVAAANGPHLIIRTSWVYSTTGTGFVATLLRDLRERESIRVVSDQIGSPTWSRSLAHATATIIASLRSEGGFRLAASDAGVYHLGGAGAASRVEIAHHVMAVDPGSRHYRTRLVIPIVAAEFAAAAPRPRYSALANLRAERRFGVRLSPWRDDMARMLATLDG